MTNTKKELQMTTINSIKCAVESCEKPSRTPGSAYCHAHYMRNHKYGSPDVNNSKSLDWTVTQFCTQCGNEMRPNKSEPNGLIAYHGHGICRKCNADNTRDPNTRPAVYFDENGLTCTSCNRYQEYKHYRLNKDMISGYHPVCRTCGSLWIHNITRDQYDQLLKDHNYSCAICHRTEQELGQKLHIDHDHSCCNNKQKKNCGKCIRGLLCGDCNSGIGYFKDNTDTLVSAIQFLTRTTLNKKETL